MRPARSTGGAGAGVGFAAAGSRTPNSAASTSCRICSQPLDGADACASRCQLALEPVKLGIERWILLTALQHPLVSMQRRRVATPPESQRDVNEPLGREPACQMNG